MNAHLIARIRDALRNVIDPELGYNVVDLGFIYDIAVEEGSIVRITMTTTTPGCPAGRCAVVAASATARRSC